MNKIVGNSVPCVQQTMSHDSAESRISYNFFVNELPEVLNPLGDLSSSSSPKDDVLEGPACCALRTVGIKQPVSRKISVCYEPMNDCFQYWFDNLRTSQ